MRVLYVIDSLVPAGAERSLAAVAPHLVAAGVDLHVVTLLERPGLQDELRRGGVVLHPAIGAVRGRALAPLSDLLGRTRPDLVHTTLFEADVAGRLVAVRRRIPSVSTLASVGGPVSIDDGASMRLRRQAARAADLATARLVRRFHAVSSTVASTMSRRLRIDPGRIDVVHRGRDAAALGRRSPDRRQRTRSGLDLDERAPMTLAVARHSHQKGLDVLLAAWPAVVQSVPDALLLVAGRSGETTADLLGTVERLGLRDSVRFLGPRDDVADLLAATDAFALPSRWEGMPGALLEALALEAPIVASDLAEVREALGDPDLALLVAPEDTAALARAVAEVLLDPVRRTAATRAGRRRFLDAFTIERAAERMLAFYERALGARR